MLLIKKGKQIHSRAKPLQKRERSKKKLLLLPIIIIRSPKNVSRLLPMKDPS
jgi:hypothetical protein